MELFAENRFDLNLALHEDVGYIWKCDTGNFRGNIYPCVIAEIVLDCRFSKELQRSLSFECLKLQGLLNRFQNRIQRKMRMVIHTFQSKLIVWLGANVQKT